MTIDEKLSHFYDITVEDARTKAAAILEEHKEALEKMTAEGKALSEENAQAQIKAETANARREVNKALSAEQLTIKRDWTKKQNELKEKLFSEVKELLDSFTKTPVMGAMIYAVIRGRGYIEDLSARQVVIMAAFSLYFGFTSEGVDNAAHVGGLICGFILAVLFYHPSRLQIHASEETGR